MDDGQELDVTETEGGAGSAEAMIAEQAMDQLRDEQNLPLAIIAGGVGSIVGAAIWGGIAVTTGYYVGYIAILVGFIVGIAVKTAGKGLDPQFGVVGAVWALVGVGIGNVISIAGFVSAEEGVPFIDVLIQLGIDFELLQSVMTETFEAKDALFYGLAVYCGYRYSFRKITNTDLGLPEPIEDVSSEDD